MSLIKVFSCLKCGAAFEGILDICQYCGGRGAAQSGIQACLSSGHAPGFARSSTTPHSAKSFDKCMDKNFEIMKISNCTHKDGVPHCSFTRKAKKYNKGGYMSVPSSYGQQGVVKAYTNFGDMEKDGYRMGPMMSNGQPFQIPAVHPEIKPGAPLGTGLGGSLLPGTVMTARSNRES